MKQLTLTKFGFISAALMTSMCFGQTFEVDGYKTGSDSYTNQAAISFFNGHGTSVYGDQNNPLYQTFVHWGVGKLEAAPSGDSYFFMYVETPFEVKNMVWGNGMTQQEINQYGKNLSYKDATGSEFIAFYDNSGGEVLKTGLEAGEMEFGGGGKGGKGDDGGDGNDFGFIEYKTSLDYLLANGATEGSSANASFDTHEIGMAFEYRFALDNAQNTALLDTVRNGGIIEYHLSPERGLPPTQVPEPTNAFMALLGSAILLRRKR